MTARISGIIILGLLAQYVAAAPASVYVKGANGKWTKLSATQASGALTMKLGSEQIANGKTSIVVNKPAWMVLDDTEAPKLAWVKVNGADVKPGPNGALGSIALPATLSVGIKDNVNPLDPQSVRVLIDDQTVLKPDVSKLGPPKISGSFSVSLAGLPAGHYDATLQVTDASPQRNLLAVKLSFSLEGIAVAADKQTVTICSGGNSYTLRANGSATLQTGNADWAYLTSNIGGQHMYLDKITAVEILSNTPELKHVRVVGVPGKTDKDQDGAKLARLEYELTARRGLPCLLVKSRTVNLGPKADLYCWWGWLPGAGYVDPAGEHQWSENYKDIGQVGWVFLPPLTPDVNGIGWVSPGFFGESRFGTMLLYTEPRHLSVENMAAAEIDFALAPASKPEEVATLAAKLKGLGIW